MNADLQTGGGSKTMLWVGRVISALIVLSLIGSAVFKLMQPAQITEEFSRLGWPVNLAAAVGITELTCAILYAIPQTAVLGAILVTGYLGGAIATHVRIEEQFIPPLVMGVLAWVGLYLREPRVRALIPWRSNTY
jgi:uncharacterized membrane protein YphA (DoxX/SURF4 family)